MTPLISLVFVLGAVSAHHLPSHPVYQSAPFISAYSTGPQVSLPYVVPVYHAPQVYSASVTPVTAPARVYTPAHTVHYNTPQVYHSNTAPARTYVPAVPTVKYQTPAVRQYVRPVAILRQSQDNNYDGSFSYGFEAENGITSKASGYVKALSPKEQAQVMQGVYSYTAPDGTPIVTRWYADETGFHAEGAHLPVAPLVPEAIAKSLAHQAA